MTTAKPPRVPAERIHPSTCIADLLLSGRGKWREIANVLRRTARVRGLVCELGDLDVFGEMIESFTDEEILKAVQALRSDSLAAEELNSALYESDCS